MGRDKRSGRKLLENERAKFPAQHKIPRPGGRGRVGGEEVKGRLSALLSEVGPWDVTGPRKVMGCESRGYQPSFPGRHQVGGRERMTSVWLFSIS